MSRLMEVRKQLLELTGRELWGGISWDFIHMSQHFNAVQDLGTRFSGAEGDMIHFDTQSESTPGHEWHQWVRMAELKDVIEDPDMSLQDKVRLGMQGDLQVHCNCFTGDVKVPLLNGRELTFKEIWEEYGSKKPFWVYSSGAKGNFVPKQATCIKTRKVKKLVRVTLDNGESFTCTPDHKIRMRDGSYQRADKLQPRDSLMPLYRIVDKQGYERVRVNTARTSKYIRTHTTVAESTKRRKKQAAVGRAKIDGSRRVECHHASWDKRNNSPDNLHWATGREHYEYHKDHIKKAHQNQRRRLADPKTRQAVLEDKRRAGRASQEEVQQERWKDPELKARHSAALKESWARRKAVNNHKVVSVERISASKPVQVYCLNVPGTHNFTIGAGILVKNCPAFKYWGYQYITTQLGAAVTPETRAPNKRNPQRKGDVCKHLALVLRVLPFWWNNVAGVLAKAGYDRFTKSPDAQQAAKKERKQADQLQQQALQEPEQDQEQDKKQKDPEGFLRDLWKRKGRRERGEESLKRGRRPCLRFEDLVEEQLNY